MKKTRSIHYLLILIVLGWMKTTQAQPVISTDKAKTLVEKTCLFTDREIYCVDENILFSAFNLSSEELRKANWSNVLYVELIAPDGELVARRKCVYSPGGASGMLRIPAGTLTGNYYLRAYTRWMRDFSPYNYFYKMITVVNPLRPELLEPSVNALAPETEMHHRLTNTPDLKLETDKKNYQKRERVNLEIKVPDAGNFGDKFVVSVIPEGSEASLMPDLKGLQELKFSLDFIPETRGVSVSGKVVNEADSVPLPYTLVGLTVFKENPEIRNARTNDKGRFFFDLSRLEGEFEIFISAKADDNKTPLILVDNDFSTDRIELPYVPVDLSPESKNIYQLVVFNCQMQTLYRQQKVKDELKPFSSDSSFYGAPDFVLKLSDYVALPSVKEYFYELIPQVRVKHEGKRTALKVLGNYSELAIYEPLVLVDMVPVFDIDKVLALQPEKIERIEVVTVPYIRGDIVFGGIVSLFSKHGDLAGIDLPSAGRFITYNMLGRGFTPEGPSTTDPRVPDLRNCVYWNPSVKPDQTGSARLSFNTGDNTGNFLIVLKSIGKDGQVKVATKEISVQ